jgi:hypothetical protein
MDVNGNSIKFSSTNPIFNILIPQASQHHAVVGTHGIQIDNRPIGADTIEIGTEKGHHFLIKRTKKLFKENCSQLYSGPITGEYILVYYYGMLLVPVKIRN